MEGGISRKLHKECIAQTLALKVSHQLILKIVYIVYNPQKNIEYRIFFGNIVLLRSQGQRKILLKFLFNSFYYGCYDKNAGKQTILYPSKQRNSHFFQTQRDFYTIFCMNLHVLAKWDLFIKDLRHFNQNSLCTQLKTAILVACELQRPQLDL